LADTQPADPEFPETRSRLYRRLVRTEIIVAVVLLVALLALGVLCTAVAFLVFFALIREVGPARALVITYINPVVALFAGVLVLDEPLTVGTLVSLTLILIGSVLATRRAAPPSAAPAEAERP